MTSVNPQAAATETSAAASTPAPPEKGWSPQLSRERVLIAGALIVIGVLVALFAWGLPPFAGGDQTTNNAYVRGRTTIVSPQVAGYLVEVRVAD